MRKVYVFNTGPVDLTLRVNVGNLIRVPGANDTTWVPGAPEKANLPDFTGGASHNPGQFFVGSNSVNISLDSSGSTCTVPIVIPPSVGARNELQLYMFWKSTESVSWNLLEDGSPLADGFEKMS
jgi:hypothetical protein